MRYLVAYPSLLHMVVTYISMNCRNSYQKKIIWRYYLPYVWYVNNTPYWMLWNFNGDTTKTLLRFVTHIYYLCTNVCSSFPCNTWKKTTRKCDNKGFLPATSLNGVVGSPYLFTRSLIGSTGKYDLSYAFMLNLYKLLKLTHVP